MMHWFAAAIQIAQAVWPHLLSALERMDRPDPDVQEVSTVARCVECGEEPFVVKWGAVRVGQDLSGYYYQPAVGEPNRLLCRDCWNRVLGLSLV